jgi:hypothetical protein
MLSCTVTRRSDHAVLSIAEVEETPRGDSYYTQIPTPRRLTADTSWRVTAALRGEVHDAAPDAGKFHRV